VGIWRVLLLFGEMFLNKHTTGMRFEVFTAV